MSVETEREAEQEKSPHLIIVQGMPAGKFFFDWMSETMSRHKEFFEYILELACDEADSQIPESIHWH